MKGHELKLRIWHIADCYPPAYGGGAALYVRDVCRSLAERGHTVRVLCTEGTAQSSYTIRTEYDGVIRVDRLNLPYFKQRDPGGWQLGMRGWRQHQGRVTQLADELLQDWTPDIVQFHTPYPVDEGFLLALQQRGLPMVGMSHCAWTICPRLNLLQSPLSTACEGPSTLKCLECLYSHYDGSRAKALAKLPWRMLKLGIYPAYRLHQRTKLRRGVQAQISPSQFMAATHAGHIGGESKHLSLGVDLTDLPTARPQRPRTPLRFGFLAGFQAHKGIDDVLDAATDLKVRGLSFELHIWGPQQEGKQEELNARNLSGCVFLHGTFAPSDRWEVFAAMDMLLMATTVVEAYGRVVQEAAAAGVPTLAPAVGGITEQIRDGVDGLLYRFRDADDLERQMARVIEQPILVNQLAENLWEVKNTHAAVGALEEFYFNLLDSLGKRADAAIEMQPVSQPR